MVPIRSLSSLAAISMTLLVGAGIQACSFDWDAYDPRLEATPSGSSSSSEGAGGMASSSSSSSGSGGGVVASAASSGSGAMGGAGGMGGGGMGGGGAGGSGGMGGGSPGPCGGMYLLKEDFEQPVDPKWKWSIYAGPGTTSSQQNGQWVLQLPMQSTTSNYAMILSHRAFVLLDNEMTVEVLAVPNPATPAQSSFIGISDDNNNVRFQYEQGKLYCATTKNGVNNIKAQMTFDPVQHRFWRMREQAGNFYWETSPDGTSWAIRSQTPTTTVAPIGEVYYLLDTYVSGMHMNLGEARYDNVNGGGAPMGNYCPTSSLKDDFDDGVTAHLWDRSYDGNGCTYMEAGGELVIMPAMTTSEYCGYGSAMGYDLTSSAATVEIKQTPDTAKDTATYLTLETEQGILEIGQEGTDIAMRYEKPGMTADLAVIPYDPVAHRWWRIREQNGTTYWETSANGMTWTIRAQAPNPVSITTVDVYLIAGTGSAVMTPGEAHFDNFNIGP